MASKDDEMSDEAKRTSLPQIQKEISSSEDPRVETTAHVAPSEMRIYWKVISPRGRECRRNLWIRRKFESKGLLI